MTPREAILTCCREMGISLNELARMVNMDKGNLSRALSAYNGGGVGIRVDTLIKLIEAAGGQLLVQTEREDYVLDGEEDFDEEDDD